MGTREKIIPAGRKTEGASRQTDAVTEGVQRLFDVVRIADVSLVDCRAYRRGDPGDSLRLGLSRSARGERSPDGGGVLAQVRFLLEGRLKGSEGGESSLVIEATYQAVYSTPKELETSKAALDLFANTNATFNLWPYWREFVQTTGARMGVPGLTVPTYRVEEAFTGPGTAKRAPHKR